MGGVFLMREVPLEGAARVSPEVVEVDHRPEAAGGGG